MLTLLDSSAAFDTADHAVLLRCLKMSYSLDGCVLGWFTSYLNGRIQFIRCLKSSSHLTDVLYRVPHGLVLGLILLGRTFCSSWSQTTYVHICMLMTRRSTLSIIRQAPHSCNSRCLRASTTWRSGCNPSDCSSTRSSGARGVDDRIKYLRTHSQLAMTPSYQHHQCVTWVLTST